MIFKTLLRREVMQLESDVGSRQNWFADWLRGGMESSAGVSVTPESAMHVAAVYACIRVLSETLAQLPIHVYERQANGNKRLALEHPLNRILSAQPNGWQTSFEFIEMLQGHLTLRGNAYAAIVPGALGSVDQLIPLNPARMKVERLNTGRLIYTLTKPSGDRVFFSQDEIFHLRGLSCDGMVGMNPIELARDSIGAAKATEDHGARLFANGARPSGLLTSDKPIKKETAATLRESWTSTYGGENQGKVAVLWDGLKWQDIGMTNEDSQFLETRKFSVREIARIFHVPPHMIADLEQATFSNIEQQSLEFLTYTMLPWLRRWEAAISRDLISDERYYAKFNYEGLLRGDSAARSAFYREMLNVGVFSINEVRELEDMNPIPDGDVHLVQGAMITIERAIEGPEVAAQPGATPPADSETDSEDAGSVQDSGLAKIEKELERLAGACEFSTASYAQQVRLTEQERRKAAELAAKVDNMQQAFSAAIDANRRVLSSQVGKLVRWEIDAARRAAGKPKEFLSEVEAFYAEHTPRLRSAVAECVSVHRHLCGREVCGDAFAAMYCETSRLSLVEASGRATAANLSEVVEILTEGWHKRGAELVEQLTKEAA